ncbi:hypothetical protein [Caldicellulosiruptor naganoensis]|uniref:Uncharacterized protein n=1 Tax=Caldicellulosiruptor naganoensis TaxID=29324 RepID=A0ABY7BCH1_9FIRM|nr:hypothetical protein [Caldicellulosiruptor naganoensis]WAM30529.1 hypothetical protein OTJ99_001280 [Caldicellulosiruptor naganoensis]
MVLENRSFIGINGQVKRLGEKLDKVSYEFLFSQNGLSVDINFKESAYVNDIVVTVDIKDFEILFMPKLQKGQSGLVFLHANFQIVVFRKEKKYFLLKLSGWSNIENKYLRFCTKVKDKLLYIGFFNSFAIDDNDVCFYYQNLLTSVYVPKDSKVRVEVEIFDGNSLYDCVWKLNSVVKYCDIKYEVFQLSYKNLLKVIDTQKYSKEDVAKKFKMSLPVPSRIFKLFFLYFPKSQTNFYFAYTSTLQVSSMYYLNLVKSQKIPPDNLIYLKKQIEEVILSQNAYHNFYRNNIMLTELKTHYQLPYILLLYFQLCYLGSEEPTTEVEKIIEEIEFEIVRPFRFFSDSTLVNIENFETRFDNLLYAQEIMTIYVCYELYKELFRYYERLDYQKMAEDLKSLLILNYNFNERYFYMNNYSYKKEDSIKLVERVDKR